MAERKSVTIEIKNPEFVMAAILDVISQAEFQDGVGMWISEESDVVVEALDENSAAVWDIRNKIKEQM